jgi:hypothetical protein
VLRNSSIVVCVFLAGGTCLPSRCLATVRGIYIRTHRKQNVLISLLSFVQHRESMVKLAFVSGSLTYTSVLKMESTVGTSSGQTANQVNSYNQHNERIQRVTSVTG